MVSHHHGGAVCLSFPHCPRRGQMGRQSLNTTCVARAEQGWRGDGPRPTGHRSETGAKMGTCWHSPQGLPGRMTLAGAGAVGQGAGEQCRGQPHAAAVPCLALAAGQTMSWYASPALSQHLAFPYSMSQRDALPMAPWGSSSLLLDGGCSGPPLPARSCTASPLISAPATKTAGAFGACPAPPVTQTGPAAREQGVKGHANIWREAQPVPHPCRRAPHRQAALGGQGSSQGLCPEPPAVSGRGVLAATLRHSWSEDSQQQRTAGSLATITSGGTQAGPSNCLWSAWQQGQGCTLPLCQKAGQACGDGSATTPH